MVSLIIVGFAIIILVVVGLTINTSGYPLIVSTK
jgi:hypothetical protein